MGEAKVGEEFIKHEFDEAIAIQAAIVDAEKGLAKSHPEADGRSAIKSCTQQDQEFLRQLRQLGKRHGATGKAEGVAEAMISLMEETLASAGEAASEAYEAHAVLLNMKRKQQDSGAAMLKVARETKDIELRDAAMTFERGQRTSSALLATSLAAFAVTIATRDA